MSQLLINDYLKQPELIKKVIWNLCETIVSMEMGRITQTIQKAA